MADAECYDVHGVPLGEGTVVRVWTEKFTGNPRYERAVVTRVYGLRVYFAVSVTVSPDDTVVAEDYWFLDPDTRWVSREAHDPEFVAAVANVTLTGVGDARD